MKTAKLTAILLAAAIILLLGLPTLREWLIVEVWMTVAEANAPA